MCSVLMHAQVCTSSYFKLCKFLFSKSFKLNLNGWMLSILLDSEPPCLSSFAVEKHSHRMMLQLLFPMIGMVSSYNLKCRHKGFLLKILV